MALDTQRWETRPQGEGKKTLMTEKDNPSICESCGEEFGCGAKLDGCWCNDVKLPEYAAEALKVKFDKCLCPTCLERSIQQKKIDVV